VGKNLDYPMGLVIKVVAAVGDNVILVLTGFELNAIRGLLEQIDGRRCIRRKRLRPHRGCKTRIQLVERENDVNGSRFD